MNDGPPTRLVYPERKDKQIKSFMKMKESYVEREMEFVKVSSFFNFQTL